VPAIAGRPEQELLPVRSPFMATQHKPDIRRHLRICLLSGLIPGLILALVASAASAGFPPVAERVNDSAGVLGLRDVATLTAVSEAVAAEQGVEVVLVVIDSVATYDPRGDIESFATDLFNHRGIGNAARDDGVLILLAVGDRKVRIEAGVGYGGRLDGALKRVIDRDMLPEFKAQEWALGLEAGIHGVSAAVAGLGSTASRPAEAPPRAVPSPPLEAPEQPSTQWQPTAASGSSLVGRLAEVFRSSWILLISGFVGGLMWLRRYLRVRPRHCPDCSRPMIRLNESRDDEYLDEGQRKEEALGSVDYDVWLCHRCGEQLVERYKSWFTAYGECPDCFNRTLKIDKRTVRSATTSRTGLRRIKSNCAHCGHHSVREEVIPKQVRHHSSSSGSGFSSGGGSGGRSSGGGATGSF
jgi:uncharacterized protein